MANKVEVTSETAKQLSIKAIDAAGNLSTAATALASYAFDNVAPSTTPTVQTIAPSVVTNGVWVSGGGVITVEIGDGQTARLFDSDGTDVTALFDFTGKSGGGSTVTFTPKAGQVDFASGKMLTVKSSDLAGNLSVASTPFLYSVDNKAPADPPTIANGTAGKIIVHLEAGSPTATQARLWIGNEEVTSSKFTATVSGQIVTFTPIAGQVEYTGATVTAKAADAAGNVSPVSEQPLVYTFDNVAPAAPTLSLSSASSGTIAVNVGSNASSASLFTGKLDISSQFSASDVVNGVITFTPDPGGVEFVQTALTAKAVDAAGNWSSASAAPLIYSFDNVGPVAAPVATLRPSGVIAVKIGADASAVKLWSGNTEIPLIPSMAALPAPSQGPSSRLSPLVKAPPFRRSLRGLAIQMRRSPPWLMTRRAIHRPFRAHFRTPGTT